MPKLKSNKFYAILIFTLISLTACNSTSKNSDTENTDSQSNAELFAQTAKWQKTSVKNKITARHEAGFIALNNKLYLLGGRRINATDVYDVASDTWSAKAKPPMEIHHFQPVVYQNNIYIIGAMTGRFPYEKPLSHILIYNPKTDTWRQGDDIPKNRRRGGSGVSVYNNKIYISGGITNGHYDGTVSWFDEYNPETGNWRALTDMPNGRDHFQSAVINNKLYAGGGRITSAKTKQIFNLVVRDVDVYDFANDTWSTLPTPLPTGRAGNTTAAINKQLWVIGGESGFQKIAHNNVEIYDPKKKQWLKGVPLNVGRHGTGVAITDNAYWTISGSGNQGGRPELESLEKLNSYP